MIAGTARGTFPEGMKTEGRIAAIGDIHGRLDALDAALAAIEKPEETCVVLTGDYIDRGPDSRGVLDRLNQLAKNNPFRDWKVLPGNHDAMLWAGLARRDEAAGECWLNNGGMRLIALEYPGWDFAAAVENLAYSLPEELRQRIDGVLPVWHRSGDLLFIHAGINPYADAGQLDLRAYSQPVSSDDSSADWAWIRAPFLNHPGPHLGPDGREVIVVHGHTRINAVNVEHLLRASACTLSQGRICLDCSGTDAALLLQAEGNNFSLTVCLPEPKLDAEPEAGAEPETEVAT